MIARYLADKSALARSLHEAVIERMATLHRLLIAAAAEVNDLVVLHYDADFDRIAEVTGQPTEWVGPRRHSRLTTRP